jgi:hypothetical protein
MKKNITLPLLIALLFAGTAMAQVQRYWNGTAKPDLDFSTAGNWNAIPVAGDDAALRGQTGGATDARATMTDTWSLRHIRIGGIGASSTQGAPTLTLSSGSDLTWSGYNQVGYSLTGDSSGANGILNIEAGAHNGVYLNVGNAGGGSTYGTTGAVTIANASLHLTDVARIATSGGSSSSRGTLTISSGGTLTMEAPGSHSFYVGDTGQGRLIIDGGLLSMEAGTIMRFGHGGGDGVVELRSGTLDLGNAPQIGSGTGVIEIQEGLLKNTDGAWRLGSYTALVDSGNIVATGGVLDDSEWADLYTQAAGSKTNGNYVLKWGVTGSAGAFENAMWAVAIPEPATIGMVMLFGGGILFVRRLMI